MPKMTQTSREDVINAGLKIIKEKGIEGVNARAIAKILNTSVHPIFHHFENMEDLKKALYEKAVEIYKGYVQKEAEYRSMGLNYIKFAKEEPNIFKMLFMAETDKTVDNFMTGDEAYDSIESVISKTTKMNKEDILEFHKKMWFFAHGIAVLSANKTCILTDEETEKLLIEEFFALMKLEELKKSDEWKKIINYMKK